jgi:carotenoid cleavage dioxygenase
MPVELVNRVNSTIEPNDHPYMNGAWTPQHDEFNGSELEVIGQVPADIDGVYVRNTENPVHEPIGRYHPFDGDGMLHVMSFKDGKAGYRNRFVRTKGFQAEAEAGRALWAGLAENRRGRPRRQDPLDLLPVRGGLSPRPLYA